MPIAVARECIFKMSNLAQRSVILLFGHSSFNGLCGSSLQWTGLLSDGGRWLPGDASDPIHGAVRRLTNGNLLISFHDGDGAETIGICDAAMTNFMERGYRLAERHGLHCLITNGCPPIEHRNASATQHFLEMRNRRADLLENTASRWTDILTILVNKSQVFRQRYASMPA